MAERLPYRYRYLDRRIMSRNARARARTLEYTGEEGRDNFFSTSFSSALSLSPKAIIVVLPCPRPGLQPFLFASFLFEFFSLSFPSFFPLATKSAAQGDGH